MNEKEVSFKTKESFLQNMTINPVEVRDLEGIAKMYAKLGFVVIADAVDPRIVRAVRETVPDYVKERTNGFEHPIDDHTNDFRVRSLDLEQEAENQIVRR